jgi:hypothetical protein
VEVDPKTYSPIAQGVVLLKKKTAEPSVAARRFYDFLFSKRAHAIFSEVWVPSSGRNTTKMMNMDWEPIWLTFRLAATTTILLLVVGGTVSGVVGRH